MSHAAKHFRVYFNRHREAPQVWSVDEGTQESEVNVKRVVLEDVHLAETEYFPVSRAEGDNSPSSWFHVYGFLRVSEGVAYLSSRPTLVT